MPGSDPSLASFPGTALAQRESSSVFRDYFHFSFFGSMEVPSASRFCSPGAGGSAISYANVAAFEAGLGGPVSKQGLRSTVRSGSPITVCNPLKVDLSSSAEEDISKCLADFSERAAIFFFKGFWPSLSDLHAWISRNWDLSEPTHIFPLPRGLFIVKFNSAADRASILRQVFY